MQQLKSLWFAFLFLVLSCIASKELYVLNSKDYYVLKSLSDVDHIPRIPDPTNFKEVTDLKMLEPPMVIVQLQKDQNQLTLYRVNKFDYVKIFRQNSNSDPLFHMSTFYVYQKEKRIFSAAPLIDTVDTNIDNRYVCIPYVNEQPLDTLPTVYWTTDSLYYQYVESVKPINNTIP